MFITTNRPLRVTVATPEEVEAYGQWWGGKEGQKHRTTIIQRLITPFTQLAQNKKGRPRRITEFMISHAQEQVDISPVGFVRVMRELSRGGEE